MKRILAFMLILISFSSMAFAATSQSVSILNSDTPVAVAEVFFFYDHANMQRLTFGFTEKTELAWTDSHDDYGDRALNLKTAYVRDKITYGYGDINFYWKLKTTNSVDAKLYLEGPLMDPKTGVKLDWYLSFSPKYNDQDSLEVAEVDSYGIENGETIFSKTSLIESNVQMGYIPVRIKTAESDPSVGDQNYIGTVGVLVEIS